MNESRTLFWFRRDLRLDDNAGLYHALRSGKRVVPLFIFDRNILGKLDRVDARVSFIYDTLRDLDQACKKYGSRLLIRIGNPADVWKDILSEFRVHAVYTNQDYEPYGSNRDREIGHLLNERNIPFHAFKDQVIFEKDEVVKEDGSPYTVYTAYMKKWLLRLAEMPAEPIPSENFLGHLALLDGPPFVQLSEIGFNRSRISVSEFNLDNPLISNYKNTRDFPFLSGTSRIGPYLRFGRIGIRTLVKQVMALDPTYLKELIWREFFMQILWHFPAVVDRSFKERYNRVEWTNNEGHFKKWCEGKTGFPIVDAGTRQLTATGFMHNRVRMITAGFLCKHLLTDWRWGEAWFAKHLLDYELASNNGNWQWAAGTGCDAAPYFRVFNPLTQQQKFDPVLEYVRKWVPEYGTENYPLPLVEHRIARSRAIAVYKKALTP